MIGKIELLLIAKAKVPNHIYLCDIQSFNDVCSGTECEQTIQMVRKSFQSFFTLNDHDLKNMGITSAAHRSTILNIKNHLISIS